MTGWWRRNAIALVALATLVPLTWWLLSTDAADDHVTGRGTTARPVAVAQSADYGGATWGPAEATTPHDGQAPAGSVVYVVTLAVHGDTDRECSEPVLREVATGREWLPSRASLEVDDLDQTTSCSFAESDDYDLTVVYLVPDGAGPFTLDLTSSSGYPEFLRFSLGS